MKLSKRLSCIESMITKDSILVDIGCDHAYLLIHAWENNIIKLGYGIEIAQAPYEIAKLNIEKCGLENHITMIKSDGLKNFDYKANSFVLAGMGAKTIFDIINDYDNFDLHDEIIIQSNTKHSWLRNKLSENNWKIIDEMFLFDNKKPVFIIKIQKTVTPQVLTLDDIYLGPVLKNKDNNEYIKFLNGRLDSLLAITKPTDKITEEISIIQKYLNQGGLHE